MSGRPFYNSERLLKGISRRSFLLKAGLISGGLLWDSCVRKLGGRRREYAHIKGNLSGPNAKAGHMLRDKTPIPEPASTKTVKTLIVGSGISGLSAGRWLKKQGYNDFEILELENHTGGNAFFGTNPTSSYPLGAHYIPIVNNDDKLLVDFLSENQVIIGFDPQGQPIYNEYYLCFAPLERLLINGHWQDGIVPDFGVPIAEKAQIERFFALTTKLKKAKGSDGKYLFDIPIDNSSTDETTRALDKIPFTQYLANNGFNSPHLLWYLNYCCKDDYGTWANNISAWAGLHYFASRKGKAANAEPESVITWPEGNGWLMKRLREEVKEHVRTSQMVFDVALNEKGVAVKVHNLSAKTSTLYQAERVIMASPQFVNQKLMKQVTRPGVNYADLHYAPWLIANLTVDKLPTSAKGMVLCWDNVAYGLPSVGYVNANQQDLKIIEEKKVLTYYLPLCDREPRLSRLAAYTRTYDQWLDIVIPEMEHMHPEITPHIESVDFWLWGHGMISPHTGYIWGDTRKNVQTPINNRIFFAHTDMSGISIFEEAFHHGINAAKQVIGSR